MIFLSQSAAVFAEAMTHQTNACPRITLSVVSHGQGHLIESLFRDLKYCCGPGIEVTLTLNLPEELPFDPMAMPFKVRTIRNRQPKGFGDNHNSAFESGCTEHFCVINPDIRLRKNPFPVLLDVLNNPEIGVVAPLILDSRLEITDSARKFPTFFLIAKKLLRKKIDADYLITDQIIYPDWVAGMFMLFHRNVFKAMNGFDKDYFLYYEDVDLCERLQLAGYRVALCPGATAIHDAQRTSHRNLRYLRWHLGSMLRFFWLSACRKITRNNHLTGR